MSCTLQFHFLVDLVDVGVHLLVGLIEVGDDAAGVQHGGMVLVAAALADGAERQLGVFLGEIHADLTGLGHLAASRGGVDGVHRNVEVVGHRALDELNGNLPCSAAHILVNHLLGEVDGDLAVVDGRLREDGDHGALQLANVGRDAQGQVFGDILREFDALVLQFLVENGDAGLEVRGGQLGHETPFQTVEYAGVEAGDVGWRFIRCDDDLFLSLLQIVEDVEESLLRLLLFCQKLDVIDDEHIHVLVKVDEVVAVVAAACLQELLHEQIRADIQYHFVGEVGLDLQADGMGEVGFPQTSVGVDEEGIVGS